MGTGKAAAIFTTISCGMMAHRPMGRFSAVSRHEIAVPRQEFNVVF
jgi:hypothetical protein